MGHVLVGCAGSVEGKKFSKVLYTGILYRKYMTVY
jgi:hypothetical protein